MQADIIKVVTDACDALPSTIQKEVATHLKCCVMKCDNILTVVCGFHQGVWTRDNKCIDQ